MEDTFNIPNSIKIPYQRRFKTLENALWIIRNIQIKNTKSPHVNYLIRQARKLVSEHKQVDYVRVPKEVRHL